MSIEQSLNRLAKIKAELNKPSSADAEGLKPFKVTKRIALSYGGTRRTKSSIKTRSFGPRTRSRPKQSLSSRPDRSLSSGMCDEIKTTGGDS